MSKTRVDLENLRSGKCMVRIGEHPPFEIIVPPVDNVDAPLDKAFVESAVASVSTRRKELEPMAEEGWEDFLEEFRSLLTDKNT